jgi:hypothetical protein
VPCGRLAIAFIQLVLARGSRVRVRCRNTSLANARLVGEDLGDAALLTSWLGRTRARTRVAARLLLLLDVKGTSKLFVKVDLGLDMSGETNVNVQQDGLTACSSVRAADGSGLNSGSVIWRRDSMARSWLPPTDSRTISITPTSTVGKIAWSSATWELAWG